MRHSQVERHGPLTPRCVGSIPTVATNALRGPDRTLLPSTRGCSPCMRPILDSLHQDMYRGFYPLNGGSNPSRETNFYTMDR